MITATVAVERLASRGSSLRVRAGNRDLRVLDGAIYADAVDAQIAIMALQLSRCALNVSVGGPGNFSRAPAPRRLEGASVGDREARGDVSTEK
jgi:hypothetical protein